MDWYLSSRWWWGWYLSSRWWWGWYLYSRWWLSWYLSSRWWWGWYLSSRWWWGWYLLHNLSSATWSSICMFPHSINIRAWCGGQTKQQILCVTATVIASAGMLLDLGLFSDINTRSLKDFTVKEIWVLWNSLLLNDGGSNCCYRLLSGLIKFAK